MLITVYSLGQGRICLYMKYSESFYQTGLIYKTAFFHKSALGNIQASTRFSKSEDIRLGISANTNLATMIVHYMVFSTIRIGYFTQELYCPPPSHHSTYSSPYSPYSSNPASRNPPLHYSFHEGPIVKPLQSSQSPVVINALDKVVFNTSRPRKERHLHHGQPRYLPLASALMG